MDPWRLETKAQRRINAFASVALASCALAWLGLGSASSGNIRTASTENTGAKPIVERHEASAPLRTKIPQVIALASASIGDVEIAPVALSRLDKAFTAAADAYRFEPISLFEISLTNSSDAPSVEVATNNTPDPGTRSRQRPANNRHPRDQRGMPGRGDLHRPVSVGTV